MNYLSRHRITTTAALMLQAANVMNELLRVVCTEHIDLLYGHSRLGEWVFGGVTRDLLHKSSVCCLSRTNSHRATGKDDTMVQG